MLKRIVHAADARERWSDVLNRVFHAGERIVIVRYGREVAALIPVEDVALLDHLADAFDVEVARKAIGEGASQRGRPWNELKSYWGMDE